MASLSQRLGLLRHTLADRFRIQDYTDNWNVLDAHPGIHLCTSTTRPSWGAQQAGMAIYETDTKLTWHWSGTAWERTFGAGLAGRDERLADIATSSTTYTNVVSATATIRAGNRRHLVIAEAPGVYSTTGVTGLSIWRDGTLLQEWLQQGWTGEQQPERQPRPLAMTTTDQLVAGVSVYTLRFRAVIGFGGTCHIQGNSNKPIALTVVEI